MSVRVPLSILELAVVPEGSDATQALAASLDLAVVGEEAGYHRIWFAEHHTSRGVASTSPAVLAALAAARTERIRVGSGAVLLAHTPPVIAVEQFATIARLYPGRVDLGLGRAGIPSGGAAPTAPALKKPPVPSEDRVVEGLLVPAPPPFDLTDPGVLRRFTQRAGVVGRRADVPDYRSELELALALLGAGHELPDGSRLSSVVAAGSGLELVSLASSGGQSARVAGELGLPLAANYHVSPANVLQTVASYREAFRPGVLAAPYVIVSADVLVAADDGEAERLARGFGEWVLGIRGATGALPYPRPQAPERAWTPQERALVADRVRSRFVGSPQTVTAGLESLVRATGADELLLVSEAHDPAVVARSFRLLAGAWRTPAADGLTRRGAAPPGPRTVRS